jgi:hypothetical protein
MKHLRQYIRSLILEMAMKKPIVLASQGLALAHYDSFTSSGKLHFVLFDPEKAMKHLKKWFKISKEYEQSIGKSDIIAAINNAKFAVMEIKEETDGMWSVTRTAAESGWGPTMYELMMMISPKGFISDRTGMSSSQTWNVWEKYMEREDVQKTLLGKHMADAGAEWQNYMFSMPDDGSYSILTSNYDKFLEKAFATHPGFYGTYDKNTKEKLGLNGIVGEMFGNKYRDAGYFGGGEDYS